MCDRTYASTDEELRLAAILREIGRIVRTPTSATPYKGALDHFSADFDKIRKLTQEFADPAN